MSATDQVEEKFTSKVVSVIGRSLYLNSEQADVYFVFKLKNKPTERVPAHRAHLTAASDVFQTMFNGSWDEKSEVVIKDASPAAFKEFLQIFYLDKVTLTKQHIDKVMYLSDKYNIAECLTICEKFLKEKLTYRNVCWTYALAILFKRKELIEVCKQTIIFNTNLIIILSDFLKCKRDVLVDIMEMDLLLCTEAMLFDACMSWVKIAAKQDVLTREMVQTHLGDAFYNAIRFGSMSIDAFAKLTPAYKQIFTFDEYADIVQMIVNKEYQSQIFNNNRQLRMPRGKVLCSRQNNGMHMIQLHEMNAVNKSIKTATFSSNEPIEISKSIIIRTDENNEVFESFNLIIVQTSQCVGSNESKENVIYNKTHSFEEYISDCGRKFVFALINMKHIALKCGFNYEIRIENISIGIYRTAIVVMGPNGSGPRFSDLESINALPFGLTITGTHRSAYQLSNNMSILMPLNSNNSV